MNKMYSLYFDDSFLYGSSPEEDSDINLYEEIENCIFDYLFN